MKEYYYIDAASKRQGPVPGESLPACGVTESTYVWSEGMGNQWMKASEVVELKPLFQVSQPTMPYNNPTYPAQQPQRPGAFGAATPGSFGAQQPGAFSAQQPLQPQHPGSFGAQQPQQPASFGAQQPGYNQPPYVNPVQPQQPGMNGYNNMQKPDNYLVWAILVTILCCLIGGIVAIVYASKVDSNWNAGNYQAAIEASNKAKTWCIVSAIVGLVVSGLYSIIIFASM